MDQSRRAVEAYWRTRMVDGVTADEEKVAPVYKLEEICELLRSSPAGIVKEVSEYIIKRIDHKSPVVKQKALRLVKYAVGKSGAEFRREMQRHSGAIRPLVHFKGQEDSLKGDALNKAVRETAQETVSAIFAVEDSKVATPTEGLNKRIQGFGNTNFEMPSEEKKSFLSEVVGLGSASIMQGLSTIASAHSLKKNDNGSYKSPTLRRSLTTEIDSRDKYGVKEHHEEIRTSAGVPKNMGSGSWNQDSRASMVSVTNEDPALNQTGVNSREERLLETIVTAGGVRLQPTRDALQAFLKEALKLDAVAMSRAIEMKLQSHLWQVRMKAICVLESILRKKDDEHFSIIASYFTENRDSVVRCSELPQASLRDKAVKVLSLLDGENAYGARARGEPSDAKTLPATVVEMPDLIDTGDLDDYGNESFNQKCADQGIEGLSSADSLVDDLFGSSSIADLSSAPERTEDDPFAGVSFHTTEEKEQDIFSGLTVDERRSSFELDKPVSTGPQFLDIFSNNPDQSLQGSQIHKQNLNDLMSGLSLNGGTQENEQHVAHGSAFSVPTLFDGSNQQAQLPSSATFNGMVGSNAFTPLGQYNLPPNIMFNQVFATQPINYAAMGTYFSQQQLLFQNLGNLNSGYVHTAGNTMEGGYSSPSPLPDIFQLSSSPVQNHGAVINNPKKEETKAFDFIADHLSTARDSKRVS